MSGHKVGVPTVLFLMLVMIGILVSLLFISVPELSQNKPSKTANLTKEDRFLLRKNSTEKYSTLVTKETTIAEKSGASKSSLASIKKTQHLDEEDLNDVESSETEKPNAILETLIGSSGSTDTATVDYLDSLSEVFDGDIKR